MNVKLTLRMEDGEIRRAKTEARRRGKSVSRMVADYFDSLGKRPNRAKTLPPVTSMLIGIIKDRSTSESDYKRHLSEKHR
jgi:hypothetical protein